VFSVFAIALVFGVTGDAATNLVPDGNHFLAFATRCVGPAMALIAYSLLVLFGEGRKPVELGVRAAVPQLLLGLTLGALMFAAVLLLLIGFGLYHFEHIGWQPAWLTAGRAIEAGVVEEVMVRGLILRLSWRAFGPVAAFAISAAAFGIGHLGNENVSIFAIVCIALEAGVMLGAFYALTGRLWISIAVHTAWNFSQGYIFGAAVSGEKLGPSFAVSTARDGYPTWLTGGPFGPEASLPALLVCSIVGAGALWLAWKSGQFDQKSDNAAQVTAPFLVLAK
jgi:membrane protease YdiL (CAAX protease family)